MKVICLVLLSLGMSCIFAQEKYKQLFFSGTDITASKPDIINTDSCASPYDLDVHVYPTGYDQYMLFFSLEMAPTGNGWINWDDGVHFSGIGSGSNWTVAAKWDSTQLVAYHNYHLKKMRIILNDMSAHTVIFKVWNGMNNNYLIYQDTIFEYDDGVWVNHDFNNDLFIDSSKELMVGYTALSVQGGNFPFGTDNGPAVPGYGDKISTDGTTWDNLSDFGLDYNWNIQFYVEDSLGKEIKVGQRAENSFMQLSGYNLYQSIAGGEYELFEFIPYDPDTNYFGIELSASPDERCFQVTAVWANPVDNCESAPALSENNPEQDYICVLRVGKYENVDKGKITVRCYPNPVIDNASLDYVLVESAEVTLTIFNKMGETVYQINEYRHSGKQKINWDANGMPTGIYFYRLEAGEQRTNGKVVKIK